MKLIFNADDFGYSRGINYGVTDAFKLGVVRSATLMAGMPGAEHAAELYKLFAPDGFRVGVHLTLSCGRPVLDKKNTLTGTDGYFHKQDALRENIEKIDLTELEEEWEAQIQKTLSLGIKPTHFDSHHHMHLENRLFPVAKKLAEKHGVPLRVPERLTTEFFGNNVSLNSLITLIDKIAASGAEIFEIMCHPAYADAEIIAGSSYSTARVNELKILTSHELIDYLQKNNIQLANFEEMRV